MILCTKTWRAFPLLVKNSWTKSESCKSYSNFILSLFCAPPNNWGALRQAKTVIFELSLFDFDKIFPVCSSMHRTVKNSIVVASVCGDMWQQTLALAARVTF